jgi:CheY-like chemotaxis protein
LQIHQHQVQIAHEPQAALELAFASKPEVILLDIGLPGMSGYEVARRLRQDPALDRTIIIAITGYGQDEDRRRSADADIDFHLVKPVDMSVVNELLREGQRARKP